MVDACKEIKARVPLSEFADSIGLDLVAKTDHFEGRCPACGEKDSRHLYIYPDNRYYCFKCQNSGDMFDLYRLTFGGTSKDAITSIKAKYGYHIQPQGDPSKYELYGSRNQPQTAPTPKPTVNVQEKAIQDLYLDLITGILTLTDRGRDYLNSRHIEDRDTFRIYPIVSIDDPRDVKKALLERYDLDLLLRAGLFKEHNGDPLFVFYEPCVLFPCFVGKDIAGFISRNYGGKTKCFKLAGIPSPHFEGWIDSPNPNLYVFEGVIDALSYRELTGSDSFLAINGLITPSGYDELVRRYPHKKLILCLDPDQAGKRALDKIESCSFLNWDTVAREYGFDGMPQHPDGKKYDINDLLIAIERKVQYETATKQSV